MYKMHIFQNISKFWNAKWIQTKMIYDSKSFIYDWTHQLKPHSKQADFCLKCSGTHSQCIAHIHSLLKNHMQTKRIFSFIHCMSELLLRMHLNVTRRFKNWTKMFNWKWKQDIPLIFSLEIDWNHVDGLIRMVFGKRWKRQKWL